MFEQMSDDRATDLDADTHRKLESVATATLAAEAFTCSSAALTVG